MKKHLLIAGMFVILLSACSHRMTPNCLTQLEGVSTPYWTSDAQVEMTRINSESTNTDTLEYVVVAALDTARSPHLLLTPRHIQGRSSQSCGENPESIEWQYDNPNSTSLSPTAAHNLVDTLDAVIEHWDLPQNRFRKELQVQDSTFTIFTHTPEQHTFFRQPNNAKQDSTPFLSMGPPWTIHENQLTVSSYYTRGKRKIVIDTGDHFEGTYKFLYREKEPVQQFRDLLEMGLAELKQME